MGAIAIIPARSGSKGLENKNIKMLDGIPLMAHTIIAAIESGCFDEVMVSTDSEQYAEIAREYGANVPFLRTADTSSDSATSWEVVDEVLAAYRESGRTFDSFCLLQPTSPMRNKTDIVDAYELFSKKASFAVVSVCEVDHSPLWMGQLNADYELDGFIDPINLKRRQDTHKYYRLNGAIYWVYCEKFRNDNFLYQKGSFAYVMPRERSVDIDTEFDFRYAEFLMKDKNK